MNKRKTKKQIKLGNYTLRKEHLYDDLYQDIDQEKNLPKSYLTAKDVLRYFKDKQRIFLVNRIQWKNKPNKHALRRVKNKGSIPT